MNNSKLGFFRRLLAVAFVATVLLLPAGIWWQRTNIHDWWRLRNYTPSDQVAALATDTAMTDKARRLFYVYHPRVEGKETFSGYCSEVEYSIVLGCYVSRRGIYIFNVTDVRLKGIQEVTAAHEMLHVAYERLSAGERERVDELLKEAFGATLNQRVKDTITQYANVDPSVVPNELHSILGTELRDLPAGLETYYAQYFSDRRTVVALAEHYDEEFTRRQTLVTDYDTRLATLKERIEKDQAGLDTERLVLSRRAEQLDTLRGNDPANYNAQVDDYNRQVNSYNAQVSSLRARIEAYNGLVIERNTLAEQISQLAKSIDSRPTSL